MPPLPLKYRTIQFRLPDIDRVVYLNDVKLTMYQVSWAKVCVERWDIPQGVMIISGVSIEYRKKGTTKEVLFNSVLLTVKIVDRVLGILYENEDKLYPNHQTDQTPIPLGEEKIDGSVIRVSKGYKSPKIRVSGHEGGDMLRGLIQELLVKKVPYLFPDKFLVEMCQDYQFNGNPSIRFFPN